MGVNSEALLCMSAMSATNIHYHYLLIRWLLSIKSLPFKMLNNSKKKYPPYIARAQMTNLRKELLSHGPLTCFFQNFQQHLMAFISGGSYSVVMQMV